MAFPGVLRELQRAPAPVTDRKGRLAERTLAAPLQPALERAGAHLVDQVIGTRPDLDGAVPVGVARAVVGVGKSGEQAARQNERHRGFLAGEHFDLRFGVKKGSGSARSPTPAAGGALLPCHITGEVSQENERAETVAPHAWIYATSPVATAGSPHMRAGRWSYADRGSTRHPRGRPYPPYPARRIRPCSLDGSPGAKVCDRPRAAVSIRV